VLTDQGRCLVDKLLPRIGDMIVESLDGISSEEIHSFWKVSHHIAQNLAEMADDDTILD
jgi:hypothetical protein